MKILWTVFEFFYVLGSSAFAQMNSGQGSDMMGGGLGWGMNFWLFSVVIIAILAVFVTAYMMKRK